MAEVTGLRNNALPYPVYGAPFGLVLPIRYSYGALVTGAAGLDSERSLNGDTFADCTNEATEIGSTGYYYLLLTAAEMTADVVAIQVKTSTTDAITSTITLYPRKLVTIRSGTAASAGSVTSTIILDSGASAEDDFYNGMLVVATIDSNVESRIISDYTGSSKTATVVPDWNVAPDSDDTFVIKLPEGWQVHQSNQTMLGGSSQSATDLKDFADDGYDPSTNKVQGVVLADTVTTLTNLPAITSNWLTTAGIADNAITAAKLAANCITSFQLDTECITSSKFAVGAITSTVLQTNCIGSNQLAASAITEIQSGLATTAELDKVPKSDGSVSWNATALAAINTQADTALSDAGVTSARMGYLDNVNIGGNVASSAEVTSVQNNTRVVRVVPTVIERPDSGTTTYRIELLAYDTTGNMEAPDSAPTLALVDQGGTDLSARLDSATGSLVSTGRYRWVYTASDTDELEQLVWTFSVVEGGNTRLYGNTSVIVDTTAVDFTSSDRTKLEALYDGVNVTSWRGDAPDLLVAGRVPADLGGIDGSDDDIEKFAAFASAIDASGNVPVLNVAGKVLGGGSGTITGTGARSDVRAWNGTSPGNLDGNGYVPANVAAVNGNTTRANNLATTLDNYSATRGLAGTALPAAAANAAGGLPVSAAGSLSMDTLASNAAAAKTVTDKLDDTLEDNAGTFRFTEPALVNAPTIGGEYDEVLGEIAALAEAIKDKTDQLVFTNENKVDAALLAVADLAAAVANKLADHVRRRTQANVEASEDGDTLSLGSEYGFIQQAQESNTVDNPGKITIYQTDGTTELGQITLATDAAADPVVGVS